MISRSRILIGCFALVAVNQLAAHLSLVSAIETPSSAMGSQDDSAQGDYLKPGISMSEIIRARGFIAKEFEFTTEDGYKIHIVRGTNPLFNGGKRGRAGTLPILFIHGTFISASVYLTTSLGSKPKNFHRRINLSKINNSTELHKLLRSDASSKSLPFLAMNFGYEVWFFNRRGFGLKSTKVGHENRTIEDAIAAIPPSMLKNGFDPSAGLLTARPASNARSAQPPSSIGLQDQLGWSFIKDLIAFGVSFKSIPAAALNFGEFKQRFIQTFDPDFWDFSLDEPAYYDVPQAIDFVLKQSGKPKVHTIGLSSGGALILMATARRPELNDKIASAVLWGPSLNMGSKLDHVYELSALVIPSQAYSGPIVFKFMEQLVQSTVQTVCSTEYLRRYFCPRIADIMFGFSGNQSPIRQSTVSSFMASTSYHELAHLGQMAHTTRPCMFNHNTEEKNIKAYGQPVAPCYKMDQVQLNYISFYGGNEDRLVSAVDINRTRAQLGVASKLVMVDEPGIYWNHAGPILHDEADRLIIVPSFLDFKRAEDGVRTDGRDVD